MFLNLFIAAELRSKEEKIWLEVDYDDICPEQVKLMINQLSKALKVRRPYWADGEANIEINGEKVEVAAKAGYYTLKVNPGDYVILTFPINYRLESTPDVSDIVSLGYGSYILAALNSETEFLTLNELTEFEKTKNGLTFTHKGQEYKPLAQINHEAYHLYLKKQY
ncbi:hypothetical protein [Enterococcus sp. DIV0086]|uniref:hypothetical protein n=1 Tax=Enterococcus sp. DIV0086 TaxID=2774655 RepID=UPI003D2689E3